MKTYELYIKEDDCTWQTGEIIKTRDPLGNFQWQVYWEGGSFVYIGNTHQMKKYLREQSQNVLDNGQTFIMGKEVTQ